MQSYLIREIEDNCEDIEHKFASPGYGELFGVALLFAGGFVWTLIHFFH